MPIQKSRREFLSVRDDYMVETEGLEPTTSRM